MPRQHQDLRLCRQVRFREHERRRLARFDVPLLLHAVEKSVERVDAEVVHRDRQRRLERVQHLDHAVEIEGVTAVDRRQHHIDAADVVELLLDERVV